MSRDPLGRVKGMGDRVAERMRWEREGSTDSQGGHDMGGAGIGKVGRRSNRALERSVGSVVVEIVRFQNDDGLGLGWEKREAGVGGTMVRITEKVV